MRRNSYRTWPTGPRRQFTTEFVNEPTTLPWGNRSLLFRDPDGNLVNLFTPVTAEAKSRLWR